MRKKYNITVKQLSAMHINGGTAPDGKRVIAKYDGQAYIPATLFKGVFRGYFSVLLKTFGYSESVCELFFGKGGFQKSRVIIDNLLTSQKSLTETRTNVSISRYTRKAIDKMLVSSEVQPPFDQDGMPVEYCGEMTVYYPDEKSLEYEKLLLTALRMINGLGSGKSRGLGFVEVTAVESDR